MSRLNEIILELGIQKKEFAEAIGTSPGAISNYISGDRPISKIVAFLIEKTYGISSEWLLHGTGEKFVEHNPDSALLRSLDKKPQIREIIHELNDLPQEELNKILAIIKTIKGD